MKIYWIRGNENLSFNKPQTFFVLGIRGSGKSSLLEHVGMRYLEHGCCVFDLFGSRDGEGLAWLRSPYAKDKRILLVCGDNVDVQSSFTVKKASNIGLNDFEAYDLVISASPLYSDFNDEIRQAGRLLDLLYKRISWRKLVYMIVREASNLYYSRLRVSENQLIAKSQTTYLVREARHCGLALGLDTQRFYAVDIEIRHLADYLIMKSQGMFGLPQDLEWLYSYFEPAKVRDCPPENFFILTKEGSIGVGIFPYPEWHKREKENILRAVGLKVEYGEPLEYAKDKGTFKTMGDLEHAKIIEAYMNGLSQRKLAEALSCSSRTIFEHIRKHNEAVERSGFCPRCRRAKGPYAEQIIRKTVLLTSSAPTPQTQNQTLVNRN
mgnify:CR=1 FL=1